ncbi:MAG: aspartate kinase [Deltaproteobacteria bacterium]|nr:aspartate kinase [Deltaproteobacteria bacterium]
MALIVQKYGGTSVANIERVRNVAARIIKTKNEGNKVVVVVSAMAGETDRLISLAKEITDKPNERELDMLISTGEQVSVALLAIMLNSMGYPALSYVAHQIKIITDDKFGRARIREIESERILEELDKDKIVIVAGFQGIDSQNNITTLGRGGSDTSAVAIAAALKADICEIYTDVEGVFTTDPNIYSKARKLDKISYEEMLEMASLGAKVLQIRSVEFAKKYGVLIHVRSSFSDKPGTIVCEEEISMEKVVVSGVTYTKNDARIAINKLPDKPGVAAKIFDAIAKKGIIVDMIIQTSSMDTGYANLAFTVSKADLNKTLELTKQVAKKLGAKEVTYDENIAKISMVGVGMRSHSGVASKMFSTLAKEGINIQMISTSEIKISCIIDAKYTELAIRSLHDAFELEKG